MNTLVLKCAASANNTSLRKINELRFSIKMRGSGASTSGITFNGDGGTKIKILNNPDTSNIYLTAYSNQTPRQEFTTPTSGNNIGKFKIHCGVSTEKRVIVSCENFFETANGIEYTVPQQGSNGPSFYVDLSELNNSDIEVVDLGIVGGLEGNMKGFNAPSLSVLKLGDSSDSLNFIFDLDDLSNFKNTEIKITRAKFNGGDIYSNYLSKFTSDNTVNIELHRMNNQNDSINLSCTYVSGTSTIPSFKFQKFSLPDESISSSVRDSGILSLPDTKAFLTMLSDGHTNGSVTFESDAVLKLKVEEGAMADSDVLSLISQLKTAGLTTIEFNKTSM